MILVLTFLAIGLGIAAMWAVNNLYHPPGEAQRKKARND